MAAEALVDCLHRELGRVLRQQLLDELHERVLLTGTDLFELVHKDAIPSKLLLKVDRRHRVLLLQVLRYLLKERHCICLVVKIQVIA